MDEPSAATLATVAAGRAAIVAELRALADRPGAAPTRRRRRGVDPAGAPPPGPAVETLAAARYQRGDVGRITDGECRVSPAWLACFRREKRRLGFSLFSVLIDVGPSSSATLGALSGRLASVS